MENDESAADFYVTFEGPKDTFYEGGKWKVHVRLPMEYPYKSPSLGFVNKIYHPNVDETSGSVCLDVINQTWSPMFDLVNIFAVFLPQLLSYPNPSDPLNGEAAALQLREPEKYKARVYEYVAKYATEAKSMVNTTEEEDEDDAMSDLSDLSDANFDDDDELQMLMDDWYAYITIMPIMLYVYFFAHTYIYILDDFIIESSSKQQISKKKIYSIYIIISSVKNIL